MKSDSNAAYKYSVLQPAWAVLTEILEARKVQLYQSLLEGGTEEHTHWVGRIFEVNQTIDILRHLELEANYDHST